MSVSNLVDLTTDLEEVAVLAGQLERVDDMLSRALDHLAEVVPYDLAAILELRDDALEVRAARGRLADHRVRAHRIRLADAPAVRDALATGRPKVLESHDHEHDGDPYDGVLDLPDGHSCMVVPLRVGADTIGAMTFDREECVTYAPEVVSVASIYAHIIALAITAAKQAALLDAANVRLQERARLLESDAQPASAATTSLERSRSAAVLRLVQMAQQVAVTDAPVLIRGETGSGKEVLARAIHSWSNRRDQPFVKLNCAALPENLIESELFGHTRGAFSGATESRPGRFAVANGGTLLLDEIGDLPAAAQAKLLRVLQEGTFEPVGSDRTVKVDVRILAATHVDLEAALAEGRFREDLYYRLSVFPLAMPPLRERLQDIPLIAGEHLAFVTKRTGRGPWTLTQQAIDALSAHDWPGNVRELVNVLDRATILQPSGPLTLAGGLAVMSSGGRLPPATDPAPSPSATQPDLRTLADVERAHVQQVLDHTGGKIYGDDGAAAILGLKPSTLQSRMAKLGLSRKRSRA